MVNRRDRRRHVTKRTKCVICDKLIDGLDDFMVYENEHKMHVSCYNRRMAIMRLAVRIGDLEKEH